MTRQVNCGGVPIGGGSHITVQSMTNAKTIEETIVQIKRLEAAGCEIVRVSAPTDYWAEGIETIKKEVTIPVVADIHFDYRLAVKAIEHGADKIRINPGNIGGKDKLAHVVAAAKRAGVPIRVGVNGGSIESELLKQYGHTPKALAMSALKNTQYLETLGFDDIVISMKSSNVRTTYEAHKILVPRTDHPIHIGITEAGTVDGGVIKSSIGIGSLLLEGIGDTIRVSLTGDPVQEIGIAIDILRSLDLRDGGVEVISCPTCSRCTVDLEPIALTVESELKKIENRGKKLSVAVMGCAVNGPGEAKTADAGVACGNGEGLIFKGGEVVKKVKEGEIIDALIEVLQFD